MAAPSQADIEKLLRPYEERASQAEERLASLESIVSSLGLEKGGEEKKAAPDSMQASELLASLTDLRTTLEQVKAEQEQITTERDEVRAERDALSKALEKEKYRVLHLCGALDERSAKASEVLSELELLRKERTQPEAPPTTVDADVSVF